MIADSRLCVIGLGYVGLPLARLFATRYPVVGLDCNALRVNSINAGHDTTGEVEDELLQSVLVSENARQAGLYCSSDIKEVKCLIDAAPRKRCVFIVAVPTPVDRNSHPDLAPLMDASRQVGHLISSGDVVVYESTVYPGVTEECCIPLVEEVSGLHYNVDFYVGYSPERINPGDKSHRVESIVKVTSGSTPEVADFVDALYCSVLVNGTHKAPSIKVAEASKIIENSQRDVNIAFMNELAKIFNAMGIDTADVLAAAATKWNFIPMQPGLVGGHCIGVDPYYLIEQAKVFGVMPQVMQSARRLNDGMGTYVANQLIATMNRKGVKVKDARVLILGFSFKENCPDVRNTKIVDICATLSEYTKGITVFDPWVDTSYVKQEYGIDVVNELPQGAVFDAAILAVAHRQFAELDIRRLVPEPGVVYDVKGLLPRSVVDARL
ncbi:MAG: nucleotide sugar dehydrogenase [Bacteroidales bacterium]|nr:nucleotide sugar dehydrogenase [Bacteroidales bacterium]